ncbi:Cam1 translation elongation factor eEF1 gamma [Candida orthopsilosis Co 90-125]|uniref:Cam1 translation elongation factor eEF1 gamma n=1 Tax=Candida orthopsilosis (strain 90-125) TaxID=1136231 RepID=H8X2R4_CANO9|nr:Cam1 translation elongation factor eEF1 gamma [Candida orthopsilosis Co 90-125]CCG25611.1 Cam1 translation elongation factor eEF1 gamma [Candida orthopsilosis Co 90-125]
MSLGTLYATQQIRSLPAKALAKYFNLDIKISDKDAAYEKNFPLNKIPAFIGPKGFTLTEVIAICLYFPAFDVAPDWESYEFTKLDASKEEDKKFFDNMLAWDEPVVINGEKREISDGKVFK